MLQVSPGNFGRPFLLGHFVNQRHRRFGQDADARVIISKFSPPDSASARNASFSHASSTSPISRCTNVLVEPRAPESSTGTRLKICETNSRALTLAALTASAWAGSFNLQNRPVLASTRTPSSQVVPACAAACLGIRCNDRDLALDEIVPIADLLRVPFANEKTIVEVYGALLFGKRDCQLSGSNFPLEAIA